MLLLHGSGLQNARFTLQAEGIRITRTQAAPNGHWAFLWLPGRSSPNASP